MILIYIVSFPSTTQVVNFFLPEILNGEVLKKHPLPPTARVFYISVYV